MSDDANQRRAVRAATNHLVGIACRRGHVTARIIDLSMTGARIATHESLTIGEQVMVTSARMGGRPGVVVRCQDGELGVRFTDDIAAAHAARIAAQS